MGFTQEDMDRIDKIIGLGLKSRVFDGVFGSICSTSIPCSIDSIFFSGDESELVYKLKKIHLTTNNKFIRGSIYHMVCDIKYYAKHKVFAYPLTMVDYPMADKLRSEQELKARREIKEKENKAAYEAIVALAEAVIEQFSKNPACIQEDNSMPSMLRYLGIMKPRKITVLLERYTSELCADSAFA